MNAKVKVRTLNDFRAAFDQNVIIPQRIRDAFTAMLKEGPETWDYEIDFMRRAGVGQVQLSAFRPQFEKHIVVVRANARGGSEKRIWFADAKVAAKARGE